MTYQQYQPPKTETTPLPKTINVGVVGKLIIPTNVQEMINILHSKVGNIEWSGRFFYNLSKGNLKKLKELEFKTTFLYPLSVDTMGATEFGAEGALMRAYDIHPDGIEESTGSIHSHHNMSAFFSGTDDNDLVRNSLHYNYYISLVVAFAKPYKAKIAIPSKSVTKSTHKIKGENGEEITLSTTSENTTVIVGELIVELEGASQSIPWLEERINTLLETKKTKAYSPTPYSGEHTTGLLKPAKGDKIVKTLVTLCNLNSVTEHYSIYSAMGDLKSLTMDEHDIFEELLEEQGPSIIVAAFPEVSGNHSLLLKTVNQLLSELASYTYYRTYDGYIVVEEFLEGVRDEITLALDGVTYGNQR